MILIASDLDGTLLHQDCTISDYTKNVFRALIQKGNFLIVPTTGRCFRSVEKVIGDVEELRYFNTCNGTVLYDRKEDKILINHVVPTDLAYEIFIDVQKLGGAMEVYSGLDSYLDKNKFDLAMKGFNKELSENLYSTTILRSLKSMKNGIRSGKMQVNKFNAVLRSEKDKQKIYDKYKDREDVVVTVPTPYNLEIFYAGCDKDAGIRYLEEKEAIAHEDTIAIGDSLNDMVVVSYAHLGVCVDNAMEPLKEVADIVVGSCFDDGPAHFLEERFLKEPEKEEKEKKEEKKKEEENTPRNNRPEETVKLPESTLKRSRSPKGKWVKGLLGLALIILLIAAGSIYFFTMDGSPFFETMIQGEIDDFEKSQSQMDAEYVGTGRIPVDVIDESAQIFNVYYKETLSKNAPIVISIHGGGLITGNKEYNHYACEEICERGCLVYAIDYPLVPEVYVPDQLREVSQLIDVVVEDARDRGFLSEKVFLLGDSAGGFLSLYVTAIQNDPEMAKAFDVEAAQTKIGGVATFSGMFYTTERDNIGIFMSNHYYGNFYQSKPFAKYLKPGYLAENISLPPMYLVSSSGDYLLDQSKNFAQVMTQAGQQIELDIVEDDKLEHDFPIIHPYIDASQSVFDNVARYFKEK